MTVGTVLQHDITLQHDDTGQLQTEFGHWKQRTFIYTTISHSVIFDIMHVTNIHTYLLTKQIMDCIKILKKFPYIRKIAL